MLGEKMNVMLIDKTGRGVRRYVPTFARAFDVLAGREAKTRGLQKPQEAIKLTRKQEKERLFERLLDASAALHRYNFGSEHSLTDATVFKEDMRKATEMTAEVLRYSQYLTAEQADSISGCIEAGKRQFSIYGGDSYMDTDWPRFHVTRRILDHIFIYTEAMLVYIAKNIGMEIEIPGERILEQLKARHGRLTSYFVSPDLLTGFRLLNSVMTGVKVDTPPPAKPLEFAMGCDFVNIFIVRGLAFTTERFDWLNESIEEYEEAYAQGEKYFR
jgi:hypothetical protein